MKNHLLGREAVRGGFLLDGGTFSMVVDRIAKKR